VTKGGALFRLFSWKGIKVNPVATRFYELWLCMTAWASGYIGRLSDDDLRMEVAPGRNHGVWVLGHLIESEDELSKFLGKGAMLYPDYEETFGMKSKLLPVEAYGQVAKLREQWNTVVAKNDAMFRNLNDAEWDEPHALVEGDVKDDFYGTKGRCVYLWNLHQMYHVGQLALLLAKVGKNVY
jgi:hypothetical protein